MAICCPVLLRPLSKIFRNAAQLGTVDKVGDYEQEEELRQEKRCSLGDSALCQRWRNKYLDEILIVILRIVDILPHHQMKGKWCRKCGLMLGDIL